MEHCPFMGYRIAEAIGAKDGDHAESLAPFSAVAVAPRFRSTFRFHRSSRRGVNGLTFHPRFSSARSNGSPMTGNPPIALSTVTRPALHLTRTAMTAACADRGPARHILSGCRPSRVASSATARASARLWPCLRPAFARNPRLACPFQRVDRNGGGHGKISLCLMMRA